MKYYKIKFSLTDHDKNELKDELLLQTARDILYSLAGEAGFDSFEESKNGITGYIQKHLLDYETLNNNISFFPIKDIKISYDVEEAEDKNWNKTWEDEGFEPININNKLVIHDTIHSIPYNLSGISEITIDTKQAFGTGGHETTFMIVSELTETDLENKSMLDCGCGTGILSIVAAKNGARDIVSYDIDEWSVTNTIHNCKINKIFNVAVLHGNADILNKIKTKFDIITANINRNILLADMPSFKQKMNKNAILIISGFYINDADLLIRKANELSLELTKRKDKNNWCMLVFKFR